MDDQCDTCGKYLYTRHDAEKHLRYMQALNDNDRLRAENERLQALLANAHTTVANHAAAWWRVHCGNVGRENSKAFQFSRAAHEDFCVVERYLRAALAAKGE